MLTADQINIESIRILDRRGPDVYIETTLSLPAPSHDHEFIELQTLTVRQWVRCDELAVAS